MKNSTISTPSIPVRNSELPKVQSGEFENSRTNEIRPKRKLMNRLKAWWDEFVDIGDDCSNDYGLDYFESWDFGPSMGTHIESEKSLIKSRRDVMPSQFGKAEVPTTKDNPASKG